MTVKKVRSYNTLGPGGPGEGYGLYQKDQVGANSPRGPDGIRRLTPNPYRGTTDIEYNSPVRILNPGWGTTDSSVFSAGGKPVPAGPLTPIPAFDVLPKVEEAWKGSKFNAGVTLGESRESAQMMAHRLMSIAKAAKQLKKGDLGGALRNLTGQPTKGNRTRAQKKLDSRDVSGAWLELNLGWSPMLQDVFEANKALKLKPFSQKVRGSLSRNVEMRCAGFLPDDRRTMVLEGGACTVSTQVICDVSRPPTTIEALGLTDPASVAWELVPLSFVVDWALPIGRHLAAVHAVGALPIVGVVVTNYTRYWGKSRPVAGRSTYPIFQSTPLAVARKFHVERSIGGSIFDVISTLDFVPRSITPKWDPDLWKLATAAALFRQRLGALPTRKVDWSQETE